MRLKFLVNAVYAYYDYPCSIHSSAKSMAVLYQSLVHPHLWRCISLSPTYSRPQIQRTQLQIPHLYSPSALVSCSFCGSVSECLEETQETRNHRKLREILFQECGFSDRQQAYVLTATRRLKKSPENVAEILKLLKHSGFKLQQIRRIINRNPPILSLRADGTLKSKIEFFKSMGLLNSLSRSPRVLNISLDKTLLPRVEFLRNLCGSDDEFIKLFRFSLDILLMDLESKLQPTLELLEKHGINGGLLQSVISICPKIIAKESQEVVSCLKYLKKLGILEGSRTFCSALKIVTELGPDAVQKRIQHLATLGLSEDEAFEIFAKQPLLFLNCSTDKMSRVMDFVVNTAGFPANYVVADHTLFNYGVESRIRPRFRVVKYIAEAQSKNKYPRLSSICSLSEQLFLNRYVNRSSDPQKMLRIYRGLD